jgi:hypothetical protein
VHQLEKITALFIQASRLMQFNVERVITKLTKGWVVDIKNPDDPLSQGSETDSSMPEGFDSILM